MSMQLLKAQLQAVKKTQLEHTELLDALTAEVLELRRRSPGEPGVEASAAPRPTLVEAMLATEGVVLEKKSLASLEQAAANLKAAMALAVESGGTARAAALDELAELAEDGEGQEE